MRLSRLARARARENESENAALRARERDAALDCARSPSRPVLGEVTFDLSLGEVTFDLVTMFLVSGRGLAKRAA